MESTQPSFWRRCLAHRSFVAGGSLTGVLVLSAIISLVWTPWDPIKQNLRERFVAPSWEHFLGTDQFGRDIFSIIMAGAQNSITVGVVSVSIGMAFGVALDFMYAFPAILLAIMLVATLGQGAINAIVAIGIFSIPVFARLTRGAANAIWAREFILAARAAGKGKFRITVEHVLPNIISVLVVQATIQFALAILAEAALSFLGLGAQPPTPSWGRMLNEARSMIFINPWLAVYPGAVIAMAVLGLNLLGDGLRDVIDPRLARKR